MNLRSGITGAERNAGEIDTVCFTKFNGSKFLKDNKSFEILASRAKQEKADHHAHP